MKLPKRQLRVLFAVAIGLAVSYIWPHAESVITKQSVASRPGFVRVVKVYDGDTIGVSMNGSTEKIRMIGVDTPETHKPNSPPQCYGEQASQLTHDNLLGHDVRLEADPTNDNRDRYNRLLRYVYTTDGTLWNQHLVELGAGFAYVQFPFTKKPEFMQSQFDAAANKKGLWTACETHNDRGRWQTNDLATP